MLEEIPAFAGMTSCGLRLLIAFDPFDLESHHKVVVLCDFGFGEVHVNLHALVEEFRGLGGVAEEQLAHHASGSEFVQVTAAEIGEFVVFNGLHVFDSFVELGVHRLHAGLDGFVFRANVHSFEFFEHLAVAAGGDVREGGNRLQLRRTFVNGGDTSVAVEALASVFKHAARTAVNLDTVVAVLVCVFGVHALGERRASGSELLVKLEFLLFVVGELAAAFDVFETLVNVNVACCLVEESTASVETGLDVGNHLIDGREVHDGLTELLTVLGVGECFVVSHLADAHGLSGNAEACAVHEGHHVLDETELAATAEFRLGVLIDKFASRASVNTELVFDAANVHATVALVVDEHGKTATVVRAFFGAGEHQVNVGVAVRDEALHAVQVPALVGFAVGGLEHHALQVGTGIGFGQVHRHRLAGANARNEAGTLIVVTEFVQSLDTVLQGPDVFETGVGRGDHFVDGRVGGHRKVQATVATRHGHAVEACLAGGFEVVVGLACVANATVGAVRAFGIHVFGIREDGVRGDVASDFENAVVVVHSVGKIFRRIVEVVLVSVAALLELDNALHQGRTFEVEFNLGMICVEICHSAYLLFAL